MCAVFRASLVWRSVDVTVGCSMTFLRVALVTGATGFVGRATIARLFSEGWQVRAAVREVPDADMRDRRVDWRRVGEISGETDWTDLVAGCDAVVHLAARVHIMDHQSGSSLEEYRRANVVATRALAEAAAKGGVRRMLFLSSLKVNGEGRALPYNETDAPAPADHYAVSKYEAEVALHEVAAESGMEVVILRPPLVYGPGVKANFLRLLHSVDAGIPMPIASVSNQRSLIYLGNLVDAIAHCLLAPQAAGQTYLVSDGQDVSTPELVRAMARALQRPVSSLPCPVPLLRFLGKVLGRAKVIDRLVGSLSVDSSRIRQDLKWVPPFTLEQGLKETADWLRRSVAK